MVVVMTLWGKRDIINHYKLSEDKVQVIPWAPVLDAYPEPSTNEIVKTKHKFGLPDAYIFYPAQTWPHKNHIKLFGSVSHST
jgi:hypothetical protein